MQLNQIIQDFEWEWGDLDVVYHTDGVGIGGGPGFPPALAALESFSDPGIHDHVIPLFSGATLDPHFYVWLKVRRLVLLRVS